jgi:aminoglycoside 3-N-acetyltransferase
MPYTREQLANQLRELGLASGNIVLVRVALKAIGPVEGGSSATVLIEALLDVVGEDGTIFGLSHTEAGRRQVAPTFTSETPAITGGFVSAMLGWHGAIRSSHPTNSMVGIGRDAVSLLEGHDETSTCFAPMRRLIVADAKMVLIGCIDSSPGFSTVHLVYEELGLATKSVVGGLDGAYYERGGERRWFSKRDVPGCSMGFGHLYPLYRERGVVSSAHVGDAASLLVGCRDAYAIERAAIEDDPKISLCDDPDCLSCRGTKLFNLSDMFPFYARHPRMLVGLLRAQAQRAVHRG